MKSLVMTARWWSFKLITSQRSDILTKALTRIRFKEMKEFIGVQVVCEDEVKFKGENVGLRLELA